MLWRYFRYVALVIVPLLLALSLPCAETTIYS
jgi:hypothetical protein